MIPIFRNAAALMILNLCLVAVKAEALPTPPSPIIEEAKSTFTLLSQKDGLSSTSVSGIVQDSKGFIWMSTQGGLARYDGSSFKFWQNEPFEPNSLSTDLIQTLHVDPNDIIWAGTYNGLDRLDPATGLFTIYQTQAERSDSLSNNLVIALERDAQGRLWVGTATGLNRLDETTGRFVRYYNIPGNARSIPNNTIRSIHSDKAGRLWIGTAGGGFALYNPGSDDFTVLAGSPEKGLAVTGAVAGAVTGAGAAAVKGPPPSLAMQAIAEDPAGMLWLGEWGTGLVRYDPATGASFVYHLPDERIYVVNAAEAGMVRVGTWGGGMFILDTAKNKIEVYKHSRAPGSLPHDVVYSMLQDASGEFWIGTNGGGVARMDQSSEAYTSWTSNPDNPGSLPNGKIQAILVDSRKELWVSVYSGGIHRLDPKSGNWVHFRHDPGNPSDLADDTAASLYEDREGNLWACTNSGLCLYDRKKARFEKVKRFGGVESPEADIVYSILEDRRETGVYWIGTYTKGLYRWDRQAGTWSHWAHDPAEPASLSDNLINSLAYDTAGRLWVGTNNGLDRFENGHFTQYYYNPANRKGLSSSAILRVFVDSRGGFWLATRSGGLDLYDASSDSFSHFTRKDGLPSNDVNNIVEDASGNLWIITQAGIAKRDRATGTLKVLPLGKSLDGSTLTQGAFASGDGSVYFGSVGILTVFRVSLYVSNLHKPPVYITDFIAANHPKLAQPLAEGSALHLASWENSIELRFAALDFRDPSQNMFAWKLEGFDKDWTYSSTRRFAAYTNLPGGNYTFRVRAANNDGLWNSAGASLRFTVQNPVWKSPGAYLLYLLLIALLGYGVASLRSNRLLSAKVRELTLAREELVKANAESKRLAAEAEGATKAKTDFIAMVSHEVRNSLNGIIGVAELLSKDRLEASQAEEVGVIRQSGNLLLALVNDILDLSKAETDRVDLENLPWQPKEMARRLSALHRETAAEKGILLTIEADEALPETLGGDPMRIQQILENLLSNALRFTSRGEVRLRMGLAKEGDGGKAGLGIVVSDSGTGISPEKLPTIFEPFRQADASIARRFGGTGLGLSIVKRLVTVMGGDIAVESVAGKGSTFTVRLPLLAAPLAPVMAEKPSEISAAGLRVLIVDDDPVSRRVARALVLWLGGEAFEAESGSAALEALGSGVWDLVLLDDQMPGMDGFETARHIRAGEIGAGQQGVAIFSLTARLEGDLKRRCEEAGMNGFIAKPITLESLGGAIRQVYGRQGPGIAKAVPAAAGAAAAPAPAAAAAPPGPEFNLAYFEERYPEDDTLGVEILDLWLSNTALLFGQAIEGARTGDRVAARNHVHRLGGSTSIITDGPIIAELKVLEKEILASEGDGVALSAIATKLEALKPRFDSLVADIQNYLRSKRG